MPIPPYKQLNTYILKALKNFDGEASIPDLENAVADLLHLTPSERNEIHKGKGTKLHYRIAWARFYLKKQGLLESSKRGFSVLSKKGKSIIGLE